MVTGATGSGKTTLVTDLLLPHVPPLHPVIVADPKRDKRWRSLKDVRFNPVTKRAHISEGDVKAFRWGDADELAFDGRWQRLLKTIWDSGNVLLIVDETAAIYPTPHRLDRMMGRIIREGRQRNIGIWWLVQRPSQIPVPILSESESWAVFTLRRQVDRDTAAGYVGDRVRQIPPQHGVRSHVFFWSRPGMAEPQLMELKGVRG